MVEPCRFKEGDIVEIEVGFTVVPVNDCYIMKLILRSITLLDDSESDVSLFDSI